MTAPLQTEAHNVSVFGKRVLLAFPYKPGYACFLGLVNLANRTSSNTLAVINSCRKLEKQGLVQIQDGDRQKYIHLTEAGMTFIEKTTAHETHYATAKI